MSDVALRAGVSKVAVSVVLHNTRTNTRVSPATRQRILQAAQDLQYTPNGVARALLRRRMNVIGLYLDNQLLNTHNLFLAEIVGGLQKGCSKHRQDLLIHGTFPDRSVDDIYAELINGKIDGLVMFATEEDPLVARLASSSVPVLAVADAVPGLPSVVVDDRGGAALLARHLAGKGHRRVLYRQGAVGQESVRRRYAGFCEAAASLGMEIIIAPVPSASRAPSEWEQDILRAAPGQRPTAVVCWYDHVAYATMEFCREAGLRVPEDIAVVGFDGITPEYGPAATLTTIRAPWSEVAQVALDLMMDALAGRSIPAETMLPVEFVAGETT